MNLEDKLTPAVVMEIKPKTLRIPDLSDLRCEFVESVTPLDEFDEIVIECCDPRPLAHDGADERK